METGSENLVIGLILLIPGLYLLWYALGHEEFFREKRWEKWQSIYFGARPLGILFSILSRHRGVRFVKQSFVAFALICIVTGLWAMTVR